MDDYYQYIQSENDQKSSENTEDIDVFQNLASSTWGKRLGGLLDTVKKQSEVLVDITKRDLSEFAQTVREDANSATNGLTRGLSSLTMTLAPPPPDLDTLSDTQATIKPDDENDVPTGPKLDKGKGRAIDLPEHAASTTEGSGRRASIPAFLSRAIPAPPTLSQISEAASSLSGAAAQNARNFAEAIRKAEAELASAIPLPKGVTLPELEKELEKGTKWAEGYLQKFGRDLEGIFGDLVVVSGPEDEEENTRGKPRTRGKKIIVDRRQHALTALRQDPSTYVTDPTSTNPLFTTFAAGFDASEYTEEIARLLEEAPEVRTMMEELVPLKVPYDTFWLRYYFAVWRLDEEEARRKKLVRDVSATEEGEMEEFSWGEEEEGEEEDEGANKKANNAKMASSRSVPAVMSPSITSEDHFSAISAPTSTAPSIVTGSPTSSAAWDDDGSTLLSPIAPITDASTPVRQRDSTESEFEEVAGQKPEMKERKKDTPIVGGNPGGKSTKTEENEDWSDWE